MRITREQLGRIIREEAARLQEASRGFKGPGGTRKEAMDSGWGPSARRKGGARPKPAPRTLEDVGSFEAAQGGDEMRNFADALEEHRDRLEGISGREVAGLRKKIEAVMKTLRELAKEWDGLLLGPDDEH